MKDSHVAILLESLDHKMDLCLSMVGDVAEMKRDITKIFSVLDEIKLENKIFKAAIKDTSKQVTNHEVRITRLETA